MKTCVPHVSRLHVFTCRAPQARELIQMPTEITMPQQSDTMTEGAVVKWRKKEGDKVKEGDVVAEIETDKAVMEMEAFDSGTLALVLAPEGQKVPVGAAIAVLATGKENPADVKKQYASRGTSAGPAKTAMAVTAAAQPAAAPTAGPNSGQVATLETAASDEMHEHESVGHGATHSRIASPPAAAPGGNGHGNGGGNGDRIFASPLARRIAADKGIDLSQVRGSGPGGRIVQKDVLEFTPQTREASTDRA